ncbi:hypothetical protein BDW02DRAFT_463478, partial [Decorospora gaudefroyi]
TFRTPPWSYLHLRLTTTTTDSHHPPTNLSPLTIHPLLTQPLTSYFGQTGSSIPMDQLHIRGRDVWIRVPRQECRVVRAALGMWVGGLEEEGGGGRV